ncbi:MAG: Uma2 family endonuclease [Polyangiaceae bacterium]
MVPAAGSSCSSPRCTLGGGHRGAGDLGGWRRTRLPAVPNAPFFTLAPDWVCEVLSPGGAKTDRADKLPIYAREGVVHVWLVHPLEHAGVFAARGFALHHPRRLARCRPLARRAVRGHRARSGAAVG